MELVAGYHSGDSDIEEINAVQNKKVDVIELDSDSDCEVVKKEKTSKSTSSTEKPKKSNKTQNSSIDCINLDSEEELPSETNKTVSSASTSILKNIETDKKLVDKSDVTTKDKNKDYLNLADSDSDDDSQNMSNKIAEIINSAAVLNDIPCGPAKPLEPVNDISIKNSEISSDNNLFGTSVNNLNPNRTTPDCSRITNSPYINNDAVRNIQDSHQIHNSLQNINDLKNTPDSNRAFTSPHNNNDVLRRTPDCNQIKNSPYNDDTLARETKRLKLDPSFNLETCSYEAQKLEDVDDYSMYREDERIIEASHKNIVCRIPRIRSQSFPAHSNIITTLSWCAQKYSHLFLSASIDCSVKIWDLYNKRLVQKMQLTSGLKAAKWSLDGGQIITGGYGKKAIVVDVLTGKNIVEYDIYNFITSLEIHPYMEDVFLCGTRNAILGFDIRVDSRYPVRTFYSKCEEVLDIAFLDENEFVCSTNIVSHDSADRTIMVWDFSSGAILSNQIYLERFTCPSIKVHPNDSSFVAQSNGDYIVAFSTTRPYKMFNKKYVGHKVSGFGIECDISPDGKYLASGDSEGEVHFYNYSNTSIVFKNEVKSKVPVNRIRWHPCLPNTMITSTWDGYLQIWK